MSDGKNFYYRQKVTEAELDAAFNDLEVADRNAATDWGLEGVFVGLDVSEHAPNNLTVDVTAGRAYDNAGQRIEVPASQNVDVSEDYLAVSTAVATPGNEKIVSLSIKFDRALSDPRTDGNAATVYHQRSESFVLRVRQGSEGASPATPPVIPADEVRLANIVMVNAQTQVTNSDIVVTTREDFFRYATANLSSVAGTIRAALVQLQDHIEAVIGGTGLTAAAIAYAGGGVWADGTTNPATTVEAQLDKIIADLTAAGSNKIYSQPLAAGSPDTVSDETVFNQLTELLGLINLRGGLTYNNTWTGVNKFNGASAILPGIVNDRTAVGGYVLLGEFGDGIGSKIRLYASGNGFTFTTNAAYGGATWTKDFNVLDAYKWEWGSNGQHKYAYDDVNHATITWLGEKQLAYYETQRKPLLTGGSMGGTFFTTSDLNQKRIVDTPGTGTDVKVNVGPVLQNDIVRFRATFGVRFMSGTPAPSIVASVYFGGSEHAVAGTHRRVVTDGELITIFGEYTMPSDQGMAEVALLIQNAAAGTTELEGEFTLQADVLR